MSIKIVGKVPKITRIKTKIADLDEAFCGYNGEQGIPLRGGIEIYGRWETGKSTVANYISGLVRPQGTIVLVDLEGGARFEYLQRSVGQSGFEGTIIYVEHIKKGKPRTHEEMLTEATNLLFEEDVGCLILDSAAISRSVKEMEGDIGESNMGRRAQLLAQWARKWVGIVNYMRDDKLVITVNHMLQSFDGFGKYSPGGDTLKFGNFAKVWIRRVETFPNGDFISAIEIDKFRFGGRRPSKTGRKAELVILQGLGVSPELSNLWGVMRRGHAKRTQGSGMVSFRTTASGDDWTKVAKRTTLFDRAREGNFKDLDFVEERLTWKPVS